jgi:hypothetical protein
MRINIYGSDGERIGHFTPEESAVFSQATRSNGHAEIGVITGSEFADEHLYRTTAGKWVLHHDESRYGDGPSVYSYLTDAQARDWLLRSERNDVAVAHYFGPLPAEEDRRGGRPPIGGEPSSMILGDERKARVETWAREHGTSRAGAVRALLDLALDAQGS